MKNDIFQSIIILPPSPWKLPKQDYLNGGIYPRWFFGLQGKLLQAWVQWYGMYRIIENDFAWKQAVERLISRPVNEAGEEMREPYTDAECEAWVDILRRFHRDAGLPLYSGRNDVDEALADAVSLYTGKHWKSAVLCYIGKGLSVCLYEDGKVERKELEKVFYAYCAGT